MSLSIPKEVTANIQISQLEWMIKKVLPLVRYNVLTADNRVDFRVITSSPPRADESILSMKVPAASQLRRILVAVNNL